jgi:glycosyltransferase involved in cell wall biosynthesis
VSAKGRDNARKPLRVGVPADLARLPRGTGHATVWLNVLARLESRASLSFIETPVGKRQSGQVEPPQVWLGNGHGLALDVSGPQVLVVYEAGWGTPALREVLGPTFLKGLEIALRSTLDRADAIIVPSQSSRAQVVAFGADPQKVHTVLSGVDSYLFCPGRSGGNEVIARAGGRPDLPYVLFVSTVHPRKNLESLRRAMVNLGKRGFPHQLVIVGAPAPGRPDSDELMEQAFAPLEGVGNPVVRIEGSTEMELARLMAGAHAFCLPSLMEGFGLTVLEAMASGVPVIVSDRGSLPEVVGKAGIVVPPVAEDIETALAEVLDSPKLRKKLGRAARRRAAGFTWENTAEGWLAVLQATAEEWATRKSR